MDELKKRTDDKRPAEAEVWLAIGPFTRLGRGILVGGLLYAAGVSGFVAWRLSTLVSVISEAVQVYKIRKE